MGIYKGNTNTKKEKRIMSKFERKNEEREESQKKMENKKGNRYGPCEVKRDLVLE
jgi:hypothetical protein